MLIRLGCDEMPLAAAAIFFCIVSSRTLARAAARWPPFGFFHPGVADLKSNTMVSAHLLWAGAGVAASFRQIRAAKGQMRFILRYMDVARRCKAFSKVHRPLKRQYCDQQATAEA